MISLRVFMALGLIVACTACASRSQPVVVTDKPTLIANNIQFTDQEADAFWALYREYEDAMRPVEQRRATLLQQLATEWESLSGPRALELLKENLKFNQERAEVRKSFLERFEAALPAKKVVRYYQIEGKLDAIEDFVLAQQIPLVEGE